MLKKQRIASLMGIASMALAVSSGASAPSGAFAEVSAPNAKVQTAKSAVKVSVSDTSAARLGTGYARSWRAPIGKQYRASVRQHQRHASKARGVKRHHAMS